MSETRTYDVGDPATLEYTLTDASDAPIDATVVYATTKPDGTAGPSGAATDEPGIGNYSATFTVDMAGLWIIKFTASGTAQDVTNLVFYVRPLVSANVYTTMTELKGSVGIPLADHDDDDDLIDALLAASRAVDSHTERHFWKITETRTFIPQDPYCLKFGPFCDLVSATAVKTDASGDGVFEVTLANSDYVLLTGDGTANVNAAPEPRPYEQIRLVSGQTFPYLMTRTTWPIGRSDRIQITGTWGWPQVPDAVRRATRLLAAEHFKLKDAPFGAVGMGELGIIRVRDNPKAARLLSRYRKYPFLAA